MLRDEKFLDVDLQKNQRIGQWSTIYIKRSDKVSRFFESVQSYALRRETAALRSNVSHASRCNSEHRETYLYLLIKTKKEKKNGTIHSCCKISSKHQKQI